MPKWGGNPASVVEKAIAWGSVTTARVSPISRLPRRTGSIRGKALAMAFIGRNLFGRMPSVVVSERVRVLCEERHDGHHQPLPRRHERPLLVARRPRQCTNVVRNVPALLVVEGAFFSWRHVA